MGIPFFSTNGSGHNVLGENATHVLGHPDYQSCVVAHYPPPAQGYPQLKTEEQCPQSLPGLCMRRLARGYVEKSADFRKKALIRLPHLLVEQPWRVCLLWGSEVHVLLFV